MTTDSDGDLSNTYNDNALFNINDDDNKLITKRQKPSLKCVVCGDNAFGYNFDAISCESCKAFFRRTALKPPEKLKCRGNGNCEITVQKRKRCKKCRLKKCFEMGMRKEWILTEDEKKRKRRQIEENRRRKHKHNDSSESQQHNIKQFKIDYSSKNTSNSIKTPPDISLMTPSDWSRIKQIELAYNQSVTLNKVVGVPSFPATQHIHSTIELIRIPTYLASIRLITFLKNIPEFDLFNADDRVILVKYNLLAVIFMHTVLIYEPKNDTYHEHNTEDPIFQGKDWIKILGNEFYRDLTNFTTKIIEIIENDDIIIKIFFLLILFTKGFCGYDIIHEPTLKNPLIVYQIQNLYLESLYRYCLDQYGSIKTIILFTNILRHLFSIQRLAVHLKDYVHDHIDPSQVSPLMQSVLQLTETNSIE